MTLLRGPDEASIEALRDGRVAIVGYGNQGRAHALNLRDAGLDPVVGSRPGGEGEAAARADGFEPRPPADAADGADLLIAALPDDRLPRIVTENLLPRIDPGGVVGVLHGFAIRFGGLSVPEGNGLVMVAPKGPGTTLRARFEAGEGIPCVLAVEQENGTATARARAIAWAAGIGCGRAGILVASAAEEAETDLFGEQAVLCGGMLSLVRTAFATLVDAGYDPLLAYLECCHEIKQVADLLHERGPSGMLRAISSAAEYGTLHADERLRGPGLETSMRRLLAEIRSGSMPAAFLEDAAAGHPRLRDALERLERSDLEAAGAEVRALMPWLGR